MKIKRDSPARRHRVGICLGTITAALPMVWAIIAGARPVLGERLDEGFWVGVFMSCLGGWGLFRLYDGLIERPRN